MPRVSLVLVSHSVKIAEGLRDLVVQMAPDVVVLPAGGMDDGGIGTSYDVVSTAVAQAGAVGGGTVILTDLGSAVLTVDSVLDFDEPGEDVRAVDAPFVEAAVAAGVAAQGGGSLEEVVHAAMAAGQSFGAPPATTTEAHAGTQQQVALRNPLGLHARPAATVAKCAAEFDATITVNGVDAASVLALMRLGVVGGEQVTVAASGPQAAQAVAAVAALIDSGFGEV